MWMWSLQFYKRRRCVGFQADKVKASDSSCGSRFLSLFHFCATLSDGLSHLGHAHLVISLPGSGGLVKAESSLADVTPVLLYLVWCQYQRYSCVPAFLPMNHINCAY